MLRRTLLAALALAVPFVSAAHADEDAARLYTDNCAACHGGDRLGAIGPALVPDNLGRMKAAEAVQVITKGRSQTQMPAFGDKLSAEQISALASYVLGPLPAMPEWGMDQIKSTHVVYVDPTTLPDKPVHHSDPTNLFTVVEAGDHHVTILDGDNFTPIARFQSRFALHGGAKYSPDGRFVYLASRDGWVAKYDLYSLQLVAEIRAGINTRNIAVSDDGKWVAVGNGLPHSLVILDASDLYPVKDIAVADTKGVSSRVSAVYTAPPRHSFIVALKDVKEIWEVPYGDKRDMICKGFVHSYEQGMIEGLCEKGAFPVRTIQTEDVLDDFFFDPGYQNVMAAARDGQPGEVVSLVVGHKIANLDLSGMPHLGSGIVFQKDGHWMMATPHLKEGKVSVIDMTTWQTVKVIDTLGPGFFMRGHENSPYAWVDNSFSPAKDKVQIIDLRTLEIVKTLQPAPGKTTAHVEFTKDGRYALLSVMEMDGALIVYDAKTFEEVKRIPMVKPNGKYNVFNKISYSSGTSH